MKKIFFCCDDLRFIAKARRKLKTLYEPYLGSITVCAGSSECLIKDPAVLSSRICYIDLRCLKWEDFLQEARRQNKQLIIIFIGDHEHLTPQLFHYHPLTFLMRTDGLSDSSEHIREVMSIIRPLYYSIRIQGRRLYILLDSIIYAEKNNNDLIIHGVKHRYLQRKNLYDFASEITMITNSFLKISRSFMVNMAHIKSIKARIMTLSNGDQLTIPQKRLPEIKIAYYNYLNTAEK